MPIVQLQTPNGYNYAIHSSNPELIGSWFAEMITREGPKFNADEYYYLRMWPLWQHASDGKDEPDWCTDTRHDNCHNARFPGSVDGLITALTKMRDNDKEGSDESPHSL